MDKIKEIWNDKKQRAMYILVFYIVFFMIIIIMFLPRSHQKDRILIEPLDEEIKSEIEEFFVNDFFALEDYRYQLTIVDSNEKETVLEVIINESFLVTILEEKTDLIKKALIFNNVMIKRIINNSELVARSTNYIEQFEEEVYFLNSETFEQLLFEKEVTAEIVVVFTEEQLFKVEIFFYDEFNGIKKLEILYLDENEEIEVLEENHE